MSSVRKSKTLTVSINCPAERVYAFVSNPENLPKWATAFARSVKKVGEEWIVETPRGPVGFRFVPENEFGILDHVVKLGAGIEMPVRMRIAANGPASEVIFTLFQMPQMPEQTLAEDASMVERDPRTLKSLMEK